MNDAVAQYAKIISAQTQCMDLHGQRITLGRELACMQGIVSALNDPAIRDANARALANAEGKLEVVRGMIARMPEAWRPHV